MRSNIALISIIATTLSAVSKIYAAPDPNFHIYLAFGQSNMEGQGNIEGQDQQVDKRFQMISTVSGCGRQLGNWYDAKPPLANCDGKLGPVDYFGRTLVKNLPEQIKVGVAVVAIAGCDIQLFEKENYKNYNLESYMQGRVNAYGGNPYGRLVEMGKKAQESGVIKGILLHQGETNNGQQNWPSRVKGIYQNLLTDLGLKAEDVPLLAGEVVSSSQGGSCGGMNSIIQSLPQTIPTAHVISSEGLAQQGDGLHFTSAAYRQFGERYAETMLKLVGTNVSNAPVGGAGDAPAGGNTPAGGAPAGGAPAGGAPAGGAPVGGAPVGGDAPAGGNAPIDNNTPPAGGDAPAGGAPAGGNPWDQGNGGFGGFGQENNGNGGNPWGGDNGGFGGFGGNNGGNPWGGDNGNNGNNGGWNPWGGNNGGNPWGGDNGNNGNNGGWNPWGGNNGGNPWGGDNGNNGNNGGWNPWGGNNGGGFNWAAPGGNGGWGGNNGGGWGGWGMKKRAPEEPAEPIIDEACAPIWGQCGGNGYTGPTCCSEGSCKIVSEHYHQCQK